MENIQIPLKKIIPWVGLIILAVAGGTFTLTRLATTDQIEALKTQIENTPEAQNSSVSPVPPPPTGIENSESYYELVSRISELEKERQVLVNELVGNSIKALDPSTELAGLIAQLNSDSSKERKEAVAGLFTLEDARSLPSLIIYLKKRRDEATEVKYLFKWYDFFWKLDPITCLSFAVSEFQSGEPGKIDAAYNEILEAPAINDQTILETTIQKIKEIAITNSNALVRTKAKVLIQHLSDSANDVAFEDDEEPGRVALVFSIFNRNGLSNKFRELVEDSGDFTYWNTGYFLMNSFLTDVENREKYIKAFEMLVDLPMAADSLGLNLYLLSKMEQLRGNQERADYWINECRVRVPAICEHLIGQDEEFDLKALLPESSL